MVGFYYGPAGWHYDDWKGVVYPRRRPKGWHPIPYLARSINLLEVNATFYARVAAAVSETWCHLACDRPDLRFVIKAWNRLTHAGARLPPTTEVRAWASVLEPLRDAGRLLAVLLQYPPSMADTPKARDRLLSVRDMMPQDTTIATEFRHRSWMAEDALNFLVTHGLAWVNIDQPQREKSVPPTTLVTAPLAYVRLHGRNAAAWFDPHAGRDARYDYHYPPEEVEEWVDRTRVLLREAETTVVVGNNHYQGKALAVVLSLAHQILGEKLVVPGEMAIHYPELSNVHRPEPGALF